MEIEKLSFVTQYWYKCETDKNYDFSSNSHMSECAICKCSLYEESDNIYSRNENLGYEQSLIAGKCGHIFHEHCLYKWLGSCNTCPIDKIQWATNRVIDSTTYFDVKKKIKLNNICKNNSTHDEVANNCTPIEKTESDDEMPNIVDEMLRDADSDEEK